MIKDILNVFSGVFFSFIKIGDPIQQFDLLTLWTNFESVSNISPEKKKQNSPPSFQSAAVFVFPFPDLFM